MPIKKYTFNQSPDIQAILTTPELFIFTKFHKNWINFVNVWASNIFCALVSIFLAMIFYKLIRMYVFNLPRPMGISYFGKILMSLSSK